MKKGYFLIWLLVVLMVPWATQAQTRVSSLEVQTGVDASKWKTLTDAATTVLGTTGDDIVSALMNTGMPVVFLGQTYTQFSSNSNGTFKLGAPVTSNSFPNQFSASYAALNTPKILGISRDMSVGTGGYVKSEIFGTAPNRTFVVEYFLAPTSSSNNPSTVKWQIQYTETDSTWWLVYSTLPTTMPAQFQIGMSTGLDDVLTINPSTHVASYGYTSTNYGTWPGENRYYKFVPTSCPPVALTATTLSTSSIRLDWSPDGSETNWLLDFGGTITNENTTSKLFTGLTPDSLYQFAVAPLCGTDTGAWVSRSQRTFCPSRSLPYNDDFEGYTTSTSATGITPSCWWLAHMDTAMISSQYPSLYYSNTNQYHYGNYSLRLYYLCIYALPAFDVDSLNNVMMDFTLRQTSVNDALLVGVMSDLNDVSTFTCIDTIYNNDIEHILHHTVSFRSAPHNAKYIVFRNTHPATASYFYAYSFAYIDDIAVYDNGSCPAVENLQVNNITPTTADLNWDLGTASAWIVRVGTHDTVVTSNSCHISGLTANTLHRFQVAALCGTTDTSAFAWVEATTPCYVTPLPYTQNFDGVTTSTTAGTNVMPPCWKFVGWGPITASYMTPTYYPMVYYGSANAESGNYSFRLYGQQYTGLPEFDGDIRSLEMTLSAKFATANTYSLVVGTVSGDDASTFFPIDTLSATQNSSFVTGTFTFENAPADATRIVLRNSVEATTTAIPTIYIDNLSVRSLPMPAVSRLAANADTNSVTLFWEENSNSVDHYVVRYGSSSYTVYDTTYTFNNMQPGADYTFSVAAVNSSDVMSKYDTIKVHTPCSYQSVPWFENFDDITASTTAATNVRPSCWYLAGWDHYYLTQRTNAYLPMVYYGANLASSGRYSLRLYGKVRYVLPAFDVDSLNDLALLLNVAQSSANIYPLEVGVMLDPNDKYHYWPVDTLRCSMANVSKQFMVRFANVPQEAHYIVLRNLYNNEQYLYYNYNYSYSYIDDMVLFHADCPPVADLTSVATNDQITLSWTPRGSETSWTIKSNSGNDITVTDTFAVFTGLGANTLYTFSVAPLCSSGDTGFYASVRQRTACGLTPLPYVDDFETYTNSTTAATSVEPSCWHLVKADTTMTATNSPMLYYYTTPGQYGTGLYSLRLYNRGIYALPAFDVDSLNDVAAQFTVRQTASYYALEVGVMSDTTDMTTYTVIDTVNVTSTSAPVQATVSFRNAPQNAKFITFRNILSGTTSHYVYSYNYIDDISIFNNSCAFVTDLSAVALSPDSVRVSWVPGGNENQWLVKRVGSNWDTVVYDTFCFVDRLSAVTNYTFTVSPICTTGDTGFAQSVSVRTGCGRITLPWSENFDTYTVSTTAATGVEPPCWEFVRWNHNTSSSYTAANKPMIYYGTGYASSGAYCLRMYGRVTYAMPEFDAPIRSLEVSLKTKIASANYTSLAIGTMSDFNDPSTFVPLDTIVPTTTYQTYTFNLANAPADARRIAFINVMEAPYNYQYATLYIDDISVRELSVPTVSRLAAAAEPNTVTLHWEPNTSNNTQKYVVRYEDNRYETFDTFYTFHGLTANTDYTYTVAAIATSGDSSSMDTIVVHTPYEKIRAPWIEDFDSYTTSVTAATGVKPPLWRSLGWCFHYSTYQTDNYETQIYYSTAYVTSGSYSLRMYGNNKYLLPAFDIDSLRGWTLELNVRQTTANQHALEVAVMDDPNDPYSYYPVDTLINTQTTTFENYSISFDRVPATAKYVVLRNFFLPPSGNSYNYAYSYQYIDDISLVRSNCLPVKDLTATAAGDSVTLTWHTRLATSNWIVRYGDRQITVSDSTAIIRGLNYNTEYTFSVAPLCASGDTGAFKSIIQRTACGPISLPYIEDFESYTSSTTAATNVQPLCWSVVQYDTTLSSSSYYPTIYYYSTPGYYGTGRYTLRLYGRCVYALPEINVDSLNNVAMTFTVKQTYTTGALAVGVMSNLSDMSTYVAIDTIFNNNTSLIAPAMVTFERAPRTAKYIVFRNIMSPTATTPYLYSYNYIDDLEVFDNSCRRVTNLVANSTSPESMTLTWHRGGAENSWIVSIDGRDTTVLDTTVTLGGLTAATHYTFQVRPICTDTGHYASVTARTMCGLTSVPWSEDFDHLTTSTTANTGVHPDCWEFVCWNHNTVASQTLAQQPYLNYGSANAASGNYSLYMYFRSTYASPAFDEDLRSLNLQLNVKQQTTGEYYLVVGAITDVSDPKTFFPIDTIHSTGTTYTTYNVSLQNAPAGARRFALVNTVEGTLNYAYAGFYIDDISVTKAPQQRVSRLAALADTNEITLHWASVDPNNVQAYIVKGSTSRDIVFDTFLNITNLSPNTNYTYRVAPISNLGDTGEYATLTVHTPLQKLPVPWFETFENYTTSTAAATGVMPTGYGYVWNEAGGTSYRGASYRPQIYYSAAFASSGTYSFRLYGRVYVALPPFDVDSLHGLALAFNVRQSTLNANPLEVAVMDDPNDVYSYYPVDTIRTVGTTGSEHFVINLDSVPLSARCIAFRNLYIPTGTGNYNYPYSYQYIDDIRVYSNSCTPVTDLNSSAMGDSVLLSWMPSGSETQWIIRYANSELTVGDTFAYISGLALDSSYTFQVAPLCFGTDTGVFVDITQRTMCGTVPLPYYTDFENYTSLTTSYTGVEPNCWMLVHEDTTFSNANTYTQIYYYPTDGYYGSGLYTLRMDARGIYALPHFAVDSVNNLALEFTLRQTNTTGALVVGVMRDLNEDTTFIGVDTIFHNNSNDVFFHQVTFEGVPHSHKYIVFRNIMSPTTTYHYLYSYQFIDNVHVYVNSCPAVTNLRVRAVEVDSVDLTWNTMGAETSWRVSYGSTVMTVTDTVLHIGGLTPNTDYTFRVAALCGTNDTAIFRVATTHTPCLPVTVPWTDNFDTYTTSTTAATGVQPSCWTFVDWRTSATYKNATYMPMVYRSTTYAPSTPYSLRLYGVCYYATPSFTEPIRSLNLSFNLYMGTVSQHYALVVGTLDDLNDVSTFFPIDTIYRTVASGRETISLANAPASARYIAFLNDQYSSSGISTMYLDNVSVTKPDCPVVVRPRAHTTSNSATVFWERNVGHSSFLVRDTNTTPTTLYATNDTFYVANNLTLGQTYIYQVAAINATGDTSDFVDVKVVMPSNRFFIPWGDNFDSYTTTTTAVTNIMVPNTTYAWDFWDTRYRTNSYRPMVYYSTTFANSGNYCVRLYGRVRFVSPVFNVDSLNNYSLSFSVYFNNTWNNLEVGVMDDPNDPYSYKLIQNYQAPASGTRQNVTLSLRDVPRSARCIVFRNGCYYSTYPYYNYYYSTLYLDDIEVEEYRPCAKPTNLTISDITAQTAVASWNHAAGQSRFQVECVGRGATHGTGVTKIVNDTNATTIIGLSSNTYYDVYVRSICGVGDTSNWSYVAQMHTDICDNPAMVGTDYVIPGGSSTGSTSTSSYIPLGYNNYLYGYTQTIIDSVELDSLGQFQIDALDFYSRVANGSGYGNYDVYLAHTNKTYFTSTSDWVTQNLVKVYSGSLNFSEIGWHRIFFDSAFVWNGHDNVVIVMDRNVGVSTTAVAASFSTASCSTGVYKSMYCYSSTVNINPASPINGTRVASRGFMRLIGCGASCQRPDVSPITTYDYANATVTWTGTASNYQVAWRANNETNWSNPVDVTGYTYTISSLHPNTTYEVRVNAVCDTVDGVPEVSEYGVVTVTTNELPCFPPSALTATSTDYTSATFSWTVGTTETMWNLHVWTASFDTTYTVTSRPATVGGLSAAMTYNAAVSALCGNGIIESEYSDTISFATDSCRVPTQLTASEITAHSALISWQGSAARYELQYGDVNFPAGAGHTEIVTGNSYTITGLDEESFYDVIVRAICDEGIMSTYTSRTNFQTQPLGIDNVDGLKVSIYPNPTSTTTTISVKGVSGSLSVAIIDLNGRTVRTEAFECDGDCTAQLTVNDLASGTYFVRISGQSINSVKKLIVK